MRVTKIIREYVEKVVSEKYETDIKAIPVPDPVEMPEEYKEWAKGYIEEIIATCKQKREEFGINTHDAESASFYYHDYDKVIEKNLALIIPDKVHLKDSAREEYNAKVNALRKESCDKIDEILVGLEMGTVRKNELDDLLAEYK